MLPPGRHQLPLLANDGAPDGTEVSIDTESLTDVALNVDGNTVTVDIPDDQTADVTFAYAISSGDATDSATVEISVIHLGTKSIAEISDTSEPIGTRSPEIETTDDREPLGPIDLELGVPPALVTFTDLGLPWIHFLAMFVAVSLMLLVHRIRSKRSGFVAVDSVARKATVRSSGDNGDFHLRHDTEGVWATGRRRDGQIEVQTPNGATWVTETGVSRHDLG